MMANEVQELFSQEKPKLSINQRRLRNLMLILNSSSDSNYCVDDEEEETQDE